jgi:hypothetical protein
LSDLESRRAYLVQIVCAIGCVSIGLICIIGEVLCRLYHIDSPLSFTTLTAVTITALARGVPSMAANGKHQPNPPYSYPPPPNSPPLP